MACRIGITMYPADRLQYWQGQYPTLRNWTILGQFSKKSAAQRAETNWAAQYGCQAHPGGSGPEIATWFVYYFQY